MATCKNASEFFVADDIPDRANIEPNQASVCLATSDWHILRKKAFSFPDVHERTGTEGREDQIGHRSHLNRLFGHARVMRINENTALSTPHILLVPYSRRHVTTYHEWMQDPDLQAATASEPLSMDEEYAMHRSWKTDVDKLTFIICLPISRTVNDRAAIDAGVDDAPEKMVGDINLFLFDDEDIPGNLVGEVELMIARKDLWRKGYGRRALLVFLMYVMFQWEGVGREYKGGERGGRLSYFRAKINQENVGSIALFEKTGFKRTAERVNYFGEVELRWKPDIGSLRARDVEYQSLAYPLEAS